MADQKNEQHTEAPKDENQIITERRAKLAGQSLDDPFELLLGDVVGIHVRDQHGGGNRQSRGEFVLAPKRDFDGVVRVPEHGEFDDLGDQEGSGHGDVLGGRRRIQVQLDPHAARFGRRARAQVGGQLGQQRPERKPAIFLQLGIMVAMNHR